MAEHRAIALSDMPENEMVDVKVGGRDLVLVRRGNDVHALDGKCPHKGVPMSKGTIVGDQLVCGIHRAAFALHTGELQAPPACEALQRYDTRVDDGQVFVAVPGDGATDGHGQQPVWPVPQMARRGDDPRHFIIVGAGAAGWRATETLRIEGFEGQITVVGDEHSGPYDRTDLSKAYLGASDTPSVTPLRDMAVANEHGIELRHGRAVSLDPGANELTVEADGSQVVLVYDNLLLATGSASRMLPLDGADKTGIHTLRTEVDAKCLREDLDDLLAANGKAKVVIIGAGFIGLEAAASLTKRDGVSVTIIAMEKLPMARLFGDAFGERLLAEHRDAGVTVLTEARTEAFIGADRVQGVQLAGGQVVDADLVLVAVGAKPNTDWLPFETLRDGGIAAGQDLRVPGQDNIYVAGDIAQVPTPWGKTRIEHWRFAQETGELAARNMLGGTRGYESTPFFWTMQHIGGSYTLTGHNGSDDVAEGDVVPDDFAVRYVRNGEVTAVLAHGLDDHLTKLERDMAGEGPLPGDVVNLGALG
ncbi:MAG: FAD-dependent oxidoreductase [Pseudomonadota bacterium]